ACRMLLMMMWQYGPMRRGLGQDLITAGIGVIACAVAITSLAVFASRKANRDRTLLWFGIFAIFYGFRMLLGVDVVRAGFHVSEKVGTNVTLLITYCIQLPALMFALDLIDAIGTKLAKVMFVIAGLLAVVG